MWSKCRAGLDGPGAGTAGRKKAPVRFMRAGAFSFSHEQEVRTNVQRPRPWGRGPGAALWGTRDQALTG